MSYESAFATDLTTIPRNKVCQVEGLNAFPEITASEITLVGDNRYEFTKTVNFGTRHFVTPPGGKADITSRNTIANKLESALTGTDALFRGDPGRLIIRNMDIIFTEGAGNLFDLTASTDPIPLVFLENCRFIGGNSIGSIGTALVLIRNTAFINWDSGVTMTGNGQVDNTGIFVDSLNLVNVGGTQITVTGNQSIVQITNCLSIPENGGFFLSMPDVSISRLQNNDETSFFIKENIVMTDGGGAFLKPGSVDPTDPQAVFEGNTGIIDSYAVGLMAMTGNTTVTTIVTQNVYVDIAGTILAGSGNERFSFDVDTLTYIGLEPIKAAIDISLYLKREMAAASRVMKSGIFINDVLIQEAEVTMSSDITNSSFATGMSLVTGDEVKIKIQNTQDTSNTIITTLDVRILKA